MNTKILKLIREIRKYEYPTLDWYKISNPLLHNALSKEIEIEMKTIGGQNKTKLRKEAKSNPYLKRLLKRGEVKWTLNFTRQF